ncbi:MAG: dipeptidase [Planctomycetia bacterium]|nr:dipeptidase [Planctomycetia bacterium]
MEQISNYINANEKQYREKWFEALRIPSVSAQPEHKDDVKKMANWLADYIRNELHFESRVISTDHHPLVYGESPKIEGAPTILFYGHFDVQPVDPIHEWISPPFEPTIRNGNVYCRGADDDKGQLLTHLFSVKSFIETQTPLPVQIKYILEGEEEVGSKSLAQFLLKEENRQLLAADVIIVSDNTMISFEKPTITYGLRGLAGFELTLIGPNRDLHSGLFGGSVYNPAIALSKIIAAIIDENGKIQIPEFYDDIIDITDLEHKAFANLDVDEKEFLAAVGLKDNFGEPEYTPIERRCGRPSFDINGLTSGYQGNGSKTIIPAWASAKFTFRLVPNQTPEKITKNVREFIEKRLPPGIQMKLEYNHGAPGMVVPLDSQYVTAAAKSLEKIFQHKIVFTRDGGSIPIVAELKDKLKSEVLLIGFGFDDDAIHSPNEKFALESFRRGIQTSAALIEEIGKLQLS